MLRGAPGDPPGALEPPARRVAPISLKGAPPGPFTGSMPRITGLPSAFDAARGGVRSSLERFDRAAAEVTRAATAFAGADSISMSESARSAAAGATPHTADLVEGVLDLRLAKYAVSANVAVLRAADEMTEELVSIGRRR